MNRKPTKGKQKIEDVTKPGRTSGDNAQHLVINSRPMINDSTASDEPIGDGVAPQPPTAPLLTPLDRTPAASDDTPQEDAPVKVKVQTSDKEEVAVSSDTEDETQPASEKSESAGTTSADSGQPPAGATAEQGTTSVSAVSATDEQVQAPAEEAVPQSQKELEEAADAVRRERELQEYVKNRKYFVPIDVAARKRSEKMSILLTVAVLLLAFVLLDLMLDTGMIYLVQKIPHTHFFSTTAGS